MQLRILLGLFLCLFLQTAVWIDGVGMLTAVVGSVENPHGLAMLVFFGTGILEALLVLLFFVNERGSFLGAVAQHVSAFLRTLLKLVSPYPEHQAEAADENQSEGDRRYRIIQVGLRSAIKFFAIAAFFVLAAGAVGVNIALSF